MFYQIPFLLFFVLSLVPCGLFGVKAEIHPEPTSIGEYMIFQQKLDHYELDVKNKYFSQRWLYNDTFLNEKTKVIFLFIGPESDLLQNYVSHYALPVILAEHHNALVVSLEHRFYGGSVPCADTKNCTLDELRFLSSQQALADLVAFIRFVKDSFNLDNDTDVITFGGSYPGALSAYMRMKFPNIIAGAVASAAPVKNVPSSDWNNFLFYVGSSHCGLSVQNIFLKIEDYLKEEATREELETLFPWWDTALQPLNVLANQLAFINELSFEYFSFAAEFNYGINFQFPFAYPLIHLCEGLAKVSLEDTLEVFADFCNETYWFRQGSPKLSTPLFTNTRNWLFQSLCQEWGLTILYDSRTSFFYPQLNPTPESGYATCDYLFNSDVRPHNEWTQMYYGDAFSEIGNIFFSYGQYDPVQTQGISSDYANPSTNVFIRVIQGIAHGSELFPHLLHPDRPEDLGAAISEIDGFIHFVVSGGESSWWNSDWILPFALSLSVGLFCIVVILLITELLSGLLISYLVFHPFRGKQYTPLNET